MGFPHGDLFSKGGYDFLKCHRAGVPPCGVAGVRINAPKA